MRISKDQLRRIIRETKSLNESPEQFYRTKLALLMKVKNDLSAARSTCHKLSMYEEDSHMGEDPDIQSLAMDIDQALDFVSDIADAVQALTY